MSVTPGAGGNATPQAVATPDGGNAHPRHVGLTCPAPFNFSMPASWGAWKQRFLRYINIAELDSKPHAFQIDMLLYVMGPEAEKVLHTVGTPADTLPAVLAQFDTIFAEGTNIIYERFKFNTRNQLANETIAQYVAELNFLASTCDFGALRDSLVRDRLVVGMADRKASARMQLTPDLTLPSAISLAKLAEHQRIHQNEMPVTDVYLQKLLTAQNNDPVCQLIKQYLQEGWPQQSSLPVSMKPYFQYRFDFTIAEDLLLKQDRIVVPPPLQSEVLGFLHTGHQGIVKCRRRAQQSVWWLGLSQQLNTLVTNCPVCIEHRENPREPFLPTDIPTRPWERLGIDFFKLHSWYMIVIDYYSKYFEIFPLTSMTEQAIIPKLEDLFGRHGIPIDIRTDNGPQFRDQFKHFAQRMNFTHTTSSPYYSQSAGQVESAVKIAKMLLKKTPASDMQDALLAYRTTPLACGYSPAELLMGRKLRTRLPLLPHQLKPVTPNNVTQQQCELKEKQAQQYNKRHRARSLPPISLNTRVWITNKRLYGTVTKVLPYRSYIVDTPLGSFRRNRFHLIPAPLPPAPPSPAVPLPRSDSLDSLFSISLPAPAPSSPPECDEGGIASETQQARNVVNTSSARPTRARVRPAWMRDYV